MWLTQALMAELFQVTAQDAALHLEAIYAEGEPEASATCKQYLIVRAEGGRKITGAVKQLPKPPPPAKPRRRKKP